MALCPQCGSYIGAANKECRYCGTRLTEDQEDVGISSEVGVDISSSRMTDANLGALTSIYLYPAEKISWVVCMLLWLLGILVSVWILIPAVLLTLYLGVFFYSNNFAKWRRFYFRLSMFYARFAGAFLTECERQGLTFDPDMVWRAILRTLYPDELEVEFFLSSRDFWRQDYGRSVFARIMQKVNPQATEAELHSAFAHFQSLFQDEKPSRKVLITKAFLIKQHFSAQDYESFWVEVFRGKLQ